MKVLVAYATRHGATRGIAERIGQVLSRRGLEVSLRPVTDPGDVEDFDAFVVGSAAYMGTWLKEATAFVQEHAPAMRDRPLWLFSSGPIGTDKVDKQGRDVIEASIPREFALLDELVRPREEHVFFGAWDPSVQPMTIAERLMRAFVNIVPSIRTAMPVGDFRDWPEIEAWSEKIATDLLAGEAAAFAS